MCFLSLGTVKKDFGPECGNLKLKPTKMKVLILKVFYPKLRENRIRKTNHMIFWVGILFFSFLLGMWVKKINHEPKQSLTWWLIFINHVTFGPGPCWT